MDDFVRTEILGCMDNQIVLPTALRCALRSPQRRELRLKISKLCVLSANLCALPVFIDEFSRDEHPVVMQFFVPFCGHFVCNFYFTVKCDF